MRRGLVQSCEGETVTDREHKEPESETLITKPQPHELPRLAPNVQDVVGIRSGVISESMPRIAWFIISYAVAVVLAVSMRSAGYDEFAGLPAALVVWIILPFVISKACALFIRSITQTPKQHDERCTGHDQQSGD